MHTPVLFSTLLLSATLTAASGRAETRDPFWPIDYTPASAVTNAPSDTHVATETAPTQQPQPITDSDWAQARKALSIRGITQSTNPQTQEKRFFAMINRKLQSIGEEVRIVHEGVLFSWKIESISLSGIDLTPLQAKRLSEAEAPLTQQQ